MTWLLYILLTVFRMVLKLSIAELEKKMEAVNLCYEVWKPCWGSCVCCWEQNGGEAGVVPEWKRSYLAQCGPGCSGGNVKSKG